MSEKTLITGARYFLRGPGLPALMLFLLLVGLTHMGISATRQHNSHVHGIGSLNVVLDGAVLILELNSPAANIVGFEHVPHSGQQKHAIHEALQILRDGEILFVLSKNAKCRLREALVDNDLIDGDHEPHDANHQQQDHKDSHAETSHGHDEGHSNFTAIYHFKCDSPDRLKTIEVMLFSLFPGFEEIYVQLLTPGQQTAVELAPGKNLIPF